jgi:hypothetical protein
MKTFKLIAAVVLLSFIGTSQAQVSVNVSIGSPPAWAPVGYAETEYYYLPDIESYYDVRASQFIYCDNRRWIRASHLPPPYRRYDLYRGHTVVLTDCHGPSPYRYFKQHKAKYYNGYSGEGHRSHGHGNGHGHGHGKGHGKH